MSLVKEQFVHQSVEESRMGVQSGRKPLTVVGVLCATLLVFFAIVSIGLAYLIYPARPAHSRFMGFDGFILLPKGGILNVLDYLTLNAGALLIADESTGSVFKIAVDAGPNGTGETVMELRAAPSVHGVAFAREPNIAFVTRSGTNTVDVIDLERSQIVASIPVADDPDAIIYDKDTNLIYVANGSAKLATLIDPDRRTTIAAISLGAEPEYAAIDSLGGLLYQNLKDTNSVAAVDLIKRAVVGQWPLASCEGPTGMAIDSKNRRLFAACSGNSTLAVFDMERHQVIASIKIGGGPDSVAFDPSLHRIYSAGRAGKLTIVQQDAVDSYRILDEIRTHYGAHTLALDPVSHRVYVAYASLFLRPRVAVFSPLNVGGSWQSPI
jgi:DNA-binding beta-propeller fold protein YncE